MAREIERIPIASPAPVSEDGTATSDDRAPERMAPEYAVAVAAGRDQIRRGEIASAEEVEAAFRLFDP